MLSHLSLYAYADFGRLYFLLFCTYTLWTNTYDSASGKSQNEGHQPSVTSSHLLGQFSADHNLLYVGGSMDLSYMQSIYTRIYVHFPYLPASINSTNLSLFVHSKTRQLQL